MRNFKFLFVFCSLIALLQGLVQAGTYTLIDGQQITGEPISYDAKGIVFKADGAILERTPWSKFTQDTLKQLRDEAKTAGIHDEDTLTLGALPASLVLHGQPITPTARGRRPSARGVRA